jgi:solute carrier family 25, member 44
MTKPSANVGRLVPNPDAQPFLKTIEWDMMNKKKFFPLSMLSQFSVRCALFPLTVIKTQLQIQRQNDVYKGMIDAGMKIYKLEGMKGLYRGFWISSVQIVSGVFYISTYEAVRHIVGQYGGTQRTKALIGGGVASLVGQTIIVPFDVISQHAMVIGMGLQGKGEVNPLGLKFNPKIGQGRISFDIAKEILRRDGFKGFYRGYTASLIAYVPNSAMWWAFYHLYQGAWPTSVTFRISVHFFAFISRQTDSGLSALGVASGHPVCGRQFWRVYNNNYHKST